MAKLYRFVLVLVLGLCLPAAGCAPAYHHYADCCVNCRYCPPPPLPYVHYPGCVCHSCAASQHLAIVTQADEAAADGREYDRSTDVSGNK
jgi:hypothetical protein